jgi:hypothetical protein
VSHSYLQDLIKKDAPRSQPPAPGKRTPWKRTTIEDPDWDNVEWVLANWKALEEHHGAIPGARD